MPYLLRTLRKNKFAKETQPEWVPDGEVQSDALRDLQTEGNELSVWQIGDDLSDLGRVLAAVAATRDFLSNIDYALLEVDAIRELGITLSETPGQVPDEFVSTLHRDLSHLTARKVAELAAFISSSAVLKRHSLSQIRNLLIDSIQTGFIDQSVLSESISDKLR